MPFVDPFAPKAGTTTTPKAAGAKFVNPFGSQAPAQSVGSPKPSTAQLVKAGSPIARKLMEVATAATNPVQAAARALASKLPNLARAVNRDFGSIALDIRKAPAFTPTGPVEQFAYGTEPVQPYSQNVKEAGQTFQKLMRVDPGSPVGRATGAAGAAGYAALQALNFVGPDVVSRLSKLGKVSEIAPILSEAGVADESIEAASRAVAKAKTPEEVTGALAQFAPAKTGAPDAMRPVAEVATEAPVTKQRGLARGVEAKAIESKLTTGFGDLPEYAQVSMREQARQAEDLLARDYDAAKRVAMGAERSPDGLLPESVFVAVENRALREGDVDTLRRLATESNLTSEATTMGQRIRTLAERNPDSPVAAIRTVAKAREAAAARRTGSVELAREQVAKEITARVKAPTPKDWATFVKSIQC